MTKVVRGVTSTEKKYGGILLVLCFLTVGIFYSHMGIDVPRLGIRGLLTDPECTDIKHTSEIIIRDDGSVTDLGYPQAAVLPDGKALVTYYMNDKNDQNQTRYIGASILEEE